MDRPIYRTQKVSTANIAKVLNEFYADGYHLKQILPDKAQRKWDPRENQYETHQYYTVLVVRDTP